MSIDAVEELMHEFGLTEEQYEEVLRVLDIYRQEAETCQKNGAYLAGCIMIGAALEASLLAFADCYPEEALSSGSKPVRQDSPKPLVEWGLCELLAVAKDKGWLPAELSLDEDFDEERAQVGDYAEVVRQIRNLIHPARYVQDLPREGLSLDHLDFCFEVLQAATDWLLGRIGDDLRAALGEEGETRQECV